MPAPPNVKRYLRKRKKKIINASVQRNDKQRQRGTDAERPKNKTTHVKRIPIMAALIGGDLSSSILLRSRNELVIDERTLNFLLSGSCLPYIGQSWE